MDKVVVGVDGSARAVKAAQRAARLAAALDAELVVVTAFHTMEGIEFGERSDALHLSAADVAAKIAEQAIASVKQSVPEVRATPRAVFGRPAKALVEVAEELGATLIVVGNKRVQGPSRVLGSIAAGVARHAACDVYIAVTD